MLKEQAKVSGRTGSLNSSVELHPLGDSAIVVQFGQAIHPDIHHEVMMCTNHLHRNPFPGMIEFVPAYSTVTIFYDPLQLSYAEVKSIVEQLLDQLTEQDNSRPRIVQIPVCYGGECGPDLLDVANHLKITMDEVIRIHCSVDYTVNMIGFAPGFPYLSGLPTQIATPRRATPRMVIPPGSVGIAGGQTGVYPLETPGGWQLIGRTPLKLFKSDCNPPCLLQAGDIVRFVPISVEEYLARLGD